MTVGIGREGVVRGREQAEHPAVGEPRIDVGMEEDGGFPRSVTTFGVVERHVRREGDRGEVHVARLLHRLTSFPAAFPGGIISSHPKPY
jgi:hypothetical protein